MGAKNNKADGDSSVGRTPWDFATELLVLLGRIGPAAVIVAGFLVAGYFFYTEINRTRLDADTLLQQKLTSAQDQLILTYEKMSSMSEQLIGNIGNLMELNTTINKQIEEARGKLGDLGKKLEDADRAAAVAEEARKELEQRNFEILERQSQTQLRLASIEEQRKKLEVEVKSLEDKRAQADQVLAERSRQIDQQNKRIAELENQLLGPAAGSDTEINVDRRPSGLADALKSYLADPAAISSEAFDPYIGMSADEVAGVVQGGLGFETWDKEYSIDSSNENQAKTLSNIIGVTHQLETGDGRYISFGISDGSVTSVQTKLGYRLTRLPQAEDWYSNWHATLVISNDSVRADYFYATSPLETWTVDKVFEQLGYVAAERIFGVQRDYRLATLEELSTEFPTHFALWSKENDAFGRPQLVLRMMERAADFSGRRSFDARKFETALGKTGQGFYDAFVSLADALVKRDQAVLDAKLDPAFPQLDQGVAAAIMLRDDVRVEEVRSIDVADVDGNRTEQIEVVVSFDAIDPADARQRALLEFSGRSDGWRLRAVTARY